MKLCFLTFACPDWSVDAIVSAALRYRYHGVEFRCDAGHSHGVEISSSASFRSALRKQFAVAELEIPCLATSIKVAEITTLADAIARMQLASDIGARAIRVFCGEPPVNMPKPEVIRLAGDRLRNLAEAAQSLGIEIWLETHDTLHRGTEAAQAVALAAHPLVGINYDNMHPYRMHEPLSATFKALRGLIRHTHIHDAEDDDQLHRAVILPLDQGGMPMDETMQCLIASGYDGYLGGEWFAAEYGQTPDESLASFRRQMETLAARNAAIIAP